MPRKIIIQQPDLTLKEMHEKFINYCNTKNLVPRTIKGYEHLLDNYDWDEITQETIEAYITKLKVRNNTNSVNTILRGFRVFAYFCMERGYIQPFKIHLLKAEEKIKDVYTEEEILKLLVKPKTNSWCQWRDWTVINFLLNTGARVSTIINIKIKDVDMENNKILYTHTKNRKQMYVPLSNDLKQVLNLYFRLWEHTEDDWLFPNQDNKQLTDSGLKQLIRKWNLHHGIKKTSAHLYRHTFCHRWIVSGKNPYILQKIVGHCSMAITEHYMNLNLQNALDEINR